MPRVQGCTGAAHVQDVRYAAGAGMHRSGACTGSRASLLVIHDSEALVHPEHRMPRAHDCTDVGDTNPWVGEVELHL